jgi:hypothetical protein
LVYGRPKVGRRLAEIYWEGDTKDLTKLYATSGRCKRKDTGSINKIGPTFCAICGVWRRCVEITLP